MKPNLLSTLACLALLGLAGCATETATGRRTEQDAAEARQVRTILDRWLEAEGGAQRIGRVGAVETRLVMEYGSGSMKMKLTRHKWKAADGRYRFETELPTGGVTVEAYDGRVAWRRNERLGFGLVSPPELERTLASEDLRWQLKVELNYPGRRLLADAAAAGRPCHVLAMAKRRGGVEKWFVDAESGQLLRIEEVTQPGRGANVTMEFSDYRRVDGLLVPFLERRTENGTTLLVQRQSVVVDPPLDAAMFTPPAAELRDGREVERLLTRHLESLGSIDAFVRLHSRVTAATVNVVTSGLKYHMNISQKQPNFVLNEQEIPGVGRVVQGYDGTTAWVNSEVQGYRTLKGEELQQVLANADMRAEAQLRWRCPLWRLLGEREINGRRARGVALAALQGFVGNHYFDVENGRLLRIESNVSAGPGGNLAVTIEFSDFRSVDGLTMPFVTTVTNPAVQSVTTVESVRTNVPLDDAIFKPRKDD